MTNQNIYQFVAKIKELKQGYENFEIPILNELGNKIGYLKPITSQLIDENKNIFFLLTKWRRMFMKFFLTQFIPSIERTEKWLKEVVIPSRDRILFLIYTLEGDIVGNFGICNINYDDVELDNLIRGEKGGDPQLIYYSEISLLNWIFSQLNVQSVILHVFSNNSRTIMLHEKVGFKVIKEYNLWKKNIESDVVYSTTDNSGDMVSFCYLEMSLSKNEFISKNSRSRNYKELYL